MHFAGATKLYNTGSSCIQGSVACDAIPPHTAITVPMAMGLLIRGQRISKAEEVRQKLLAMQKDFASVGNATTTTSLIFGSP
jgi:hypothetical protein